MSNYTSKLNDYLYRQYDLEEGSPDDNVNALFDEDLKYHLTDGKMGSREMLAKGAAIIRQTPKSERIVEASNIVEKDNELSFHLYIRYRDPKTGELEEMHNDSVWMFNGNGKVTEVNPGQREQVARFFDDLS